MRQKDSDDLVRVGPGTTMGKMMRQYWLPAAMSSELRPMASRCACCSWANS